MSQSWSRLAVNRDVNWVPRSVTMSSGRPWSLNTWFRYRRAVSFASTWVVVGPKWAVLVRRSTQTRMALQPPDRGSSTMKSMETEDQGARGIGRGWSGRGGLGRGVFFLGRGSQVGRIY